jgi:long-chain acyl-CoA synthetase
MEHRVWHDSYDQGVPTSLTFEDLTLSQCLERTAKEHGEKLAVVFMNCRLTYAQLKDEVDRFARALSKLGVEKGTRVAIQLPNLPQVVIGYYAAQKLGAQCVMTNPLYMPREIEHQWNDAAAEVAICADFVYDQKVKAIRDKLPVKHYIIASIPEYLRFPLGWLAPLKLRKAQPTPLVARVEPAGNVHFFRELVRDSSPLPETVDVDMDDVAALQYTGGTTGPSKGAMLTQRSLSYNVQQCWAWFPGLQRGGEVFLAALPYFHIFGNAICMHLPVYSGSAMVLMPNPRDIPQMIKNISKHRVTMMPAVPAMFNAINNTPGIENIDLRSVRRCFSGSAPLPKDVMQRFEQLTGSKICEGFGMTETSPVTHVNPIEKGKIGSIGLPVSDTDARIVDVDKGTEDVDVGKEGELIVRGPQVMKGYWNKADETAGMIRDGWIHTGDLAVMDDEGYFSIVGRKKDMILAGGYNIYPDEIDDVLMGHPSVLEAGTIGVPDPKRGETVKSFVVFKPGEKVSFEDLTAYCRENLAAYKVPKQFEEREELPKSTMMKILRRELRDQEVGAGKPETPGTP